MLLFVFSLLACEAEPQLEEGFEADLSVVGGCGDVYVYATNADETLWLEVTLPPLIDFAQAAASQPYTDEFTVKDDGVSVVAQTGETLAAQACTEADPERTPSVEVDYVAKKGGFVEAIFDFTDADASPRVTVNLERVDLERSDDDTEIILLEDFSFDDIFVGWEVD